MFRDLTRKNQQISEQECIHVLKEETRGVLSVLGDNEYPYGMPMNHWYEEEDGCLYFHCGFGGHRLDSLKKHDKVSFCVYDKGYKEPHDWAWKVRSVIVFGRMEVIDDMEIMKKTVTKLCYKFTQDKAYIEKEIEAYGHETLLLKLIPEHICGKLVTES